MCGSGRRAIPDASSRARSGSRAPRNSTPLCARLFSPITKPPPPGHCATWEALPGSALALVLLLDQIPRNIFRATPRAYATDAAACAAADRALEKGFDRMVPLVWRRFFYMPFHHSENIEDQRRSVALFDALPRNPDRRDSLRRYGRPYLEVIERFGRFPHRNAILGRKSTPDEIAFLEELDAARRVARTPTQSPAADGPGAPKLIPGARNRADGRPGPRSSLARPARRSPG